MEIERIIIKSFGCVKNRIDIALTPLHAFIGPNDSGKSTILRAAYTLGLYGWGRTHELAAVGDAAWAKFRSLAVPGAAIVGCFRNRYYGIDMTSFGETRAFVGLGVPEKLDEASTHVKKAALTATQANEFRDDPKWRNEFTSLGGARMVRFDADALRQPSGLITEEEGIHLLDERGSGLPGIYDAIKERNLKTFLKIQGEVCRLFDEIAELQIPAIARDKKILRVRLKDKNTAAADIMSEGLLYYLAFVALPHLAPTSMIIVENPENGLHPARVRDVIAVLREVSKSTQVLIATHSPLVVNELRPEEVTVVTRTAEEGTAVTRILDTPHFGPNRQAKLLGDLWLSNTNPIDEGPLLKGTRR